VKPTPAVSWGDVGEVGYDQADRVVKASGKGPYAMYFCSEQIGLTAGIGTDAIRAKIKAGTRPTKETVFESNSVLDLFKKDGILEFFKVVAVKENVALAKRYKVTQDNTLVLCSPSNEVVMMLSGEECNQTNVIKALKAWPEVYAAWQKKGK
jgi:hypothetical protein